MDDKDMYRVRLMHGNRSPYVCWAGDVGDHQENFTVPAIRGDTDADEHNRKGRPEGHFSGLMTLGQIRTYVDDRRQAFGETCHKCVGINFEDGGPNVRFSTPVSINAAA